MYKRNVRSNPGALYVNERTYVMDEEILRCLR